MRRHALEGMLFYLSDAAVLEAERAAWNKWMTVRDEILQALPADQKSVYLQQTHSLCRSKYIMLKDRNNKYIKG